MGRFHGLNKTELSFKTTLSFTLSPSLSVTPRTRIHSFNINMFTSARHPFVFWLDGTLISLAIAYGRRIRWPASSPRWCCASCGIRRCVWHRWSSQCCTSLSSFDTTNDMICCLYRTVLYAMTAGPGDKLTKKKSKLMRLKRSRSGSEKEKIIIARKYATRRSEIVLMCCAVGRCNRQCARACVHGHLSATSFP